MCEALSAVYIGWLPASSVGSASGEAGFCLPFAVVPRAAYPERLKQPAWRGEPHNRAHVEWGSTKKKK